MSKDRKIRVGISCGDLNGIGMEVVLKTLSDKRMYENMTPVLYASAKALAFHKKALDMQDMHFHIAKSADQIQENALNLVNCWEEEIKLNFGQASPEVGKYAFLALKRAVEDLAGNKIDVLVTAPINKHTIQSKDFNFPGHTEYLANYANEDDYVMFMVSERLKVATVTSHIPLKDVAASLNVNLIYSKLKVLHSTLVQDFGISKPKIAVLGLNPHSGDKGLIGKEDLDIILPAITKAQNNDILAMGPYGADGFFGSALYTQFDAVLSMYHDQGLIPFKTICFDEGVNYTAGLPIVRTSPDHGVAYEIAGQNIANESSFRHAVYLACDIYKTRKGYRKLTENPLKSSASVEKEYMG